MNNLYQEIFDALKMGESVSVQIDDWVYDFHKSVGEKIYFFGRKENTYQEGTITLEGLQALLKKYHCVRIL